MVAQGSEKLIELAKCLSDINAVKFGEFKTKSGIMSPIYFDLRVIVSHPGTMVRKDSFCEKKKMFEFLFLFSFKSLLADVLIDFIKTKNIQFDNLCGVPYTALPIATLVSVKDSKPMLIRRKEAKSYGTKKLIEGKFSDGDVSLIIEDVVTSGSSVFETVSDLKKEGNF